MEPKEAALLFSILHLPAGITIPSVHLSATELVVRAISPRRALIATTNERSVICPVLVAM